jgi:geranyl-CoA carboxylase alpha subunit
LRTGATSRAAAQRRSHTAWCAQRTQAVYKILIANRGEIACRVIRTARALGYRTVAVYSDADAAAPHVAAGRRGRVHRPRTGGRVLPAHRGLLPRLPPDGADAVHPGYGFLSENADFAQAVQAAGLVFIGPPPAPSAPWVTRPAPSAACWPPACPARPATWARTRRRRCAEGTSLGYPLLVKAVAGGGGRGMRLVRRPEPSCPRRWPARGARPPAPSATAR